MRELFVLIAHLFTTVVKLGKPGGLYAVAAELTDVLHYASADAKLSASERRLISSSTSRSSRATGILSAETV